MKELSEYRRWAWNCFRCSMCKSVFPWHLKSAKFYEICPSGARYKFDAYNAQGKMDIARAIIEGELEGSDKLLDIVYKCSLCGACDYICGRVKEINPTKVIEALRLKLVRDGKGPMPEHKIFAENIEKHHNPYGEPHEERFKPVYRDLPFKKKADVIYFAGCTAAYRQPEILQATIKILNSAKVDFTVLHDNEWCCGSPLLRTGQLDLAKKTVQHNIEAINEIGANKIIATCAGCYRAFKVDYPQIARIKIDAEILHTSEYINDLAKRGELKLTKDVNLKVTYHDPCHLGRSSYPGIIGTGQFGVYEPPRSVLKSIPGVKLVEMERIKDDAWCCGAGGGVKSAFDDFALWTATQRLEEVKATGAEALVSCCPFCKLNFSEVAKYGKEKLKVYDLSELVSQSI